MLEVNHVSKYYDGKDGRPFFALKDINFVVEENEVISILGHNGAGKTTLVKCLASLLYPSEGSIVYNGNDIYKDMRHYRTQVSYLLGGERGLYNRLTGRENVSYLLALKGIFEKDIGKKIEKYFEMFELQDFIDKRVENYSRGMKQKVHIINALLADSHVILLDEPTSGMDPLSARKTRDVIKRIAKEQKKAILITSHMMNEVEDLSDRMIIFSHGEKKYDGSIEYFKGVVQKDIVCSMRLNKTECGVELIQKLRKQYGIRVKFTEKDGEIAFSGRGANTEELIERYVRPLADIIIDINFEKADLERAYIEYITSLEEMTEKEL